MLQRRDNIVAPLSLLLLISSCYPPFVEKTHKLNISRRERIPNLIQPAIFVQHSTYVLSVQTKVQIIVANSQSVN